MLRETGRPIPDDFPPLVAAAEKALLLHAKAERGELPDLEQGFRAVLQGLHQIAIGVNTVRGTARSTGHGHDQLPAGLTTRHARLVVAAAQTWSQMVLETFNDPKAPWRRVAITDE